MTIKLPNDFREVEIKVKGLYNAKRCSRHDLTSYINELVIIYGEAAKWERQNGYDAIAKDYEAKSDTLYKINIGLGAYRD